MLSCKSSADHCYSCKIRYSYNVTRYILVDEKLDTPALIAAAFGGEVQSHVIITCLVIAFLVIVIFIIVVVVIKRRGSQSEKSADDSEENWSNSNPNIRKFPFIYSVYSKYQ